mgnify:CR=1 FL=1
MPPCMPRAVACAGMAGARYAGPRRAVVRMLMLFRVHEKIAWLTGARCHSQWPFALPLGERVGEMRECSGPRFRASAL